MPKDSSLPCRDIVGFLGDLTFLDQAARATGFLKRASRKLAPAGFVKAVMLAAAHLRTSFNAIALHTGHADEQPCSRQNIFKRCNASAVAFMRAVLDHAIALKTPVLPAPATAASFKRIIIQDGSVIRFHASAAGDFPAAEAPLG